MANRTLPSARAAVFLGAALLGSALAAAACNDSVPSDTASSSASSSGSGGGASSSASSGGTGGAGGGAPDCAMNPMTHVEIINACTDAEKVDIHPNLPLLGQDGKLPPLP